MPHKLYVYLEMLLVYEVKGKFRPSIAYILNFFKSIKLPISSLPVGPQPITAIFEF